MDLRFEKIDGIGIVRLQGRLDASNVSMLKKEFGKNLDKASKFIFDMEELESIDSTGLGGIVSCLKYAIDSGGVIKIASPSAKVRMVFDITRAVKVLEIYEDFDLALASFDGQDVIASFEKD